MKSSEHSRKEIEKHLTRWKKVISPLLQRYSIAKENARRERKEIKRLNKEIDAIVAAQSLVQRIAAKIQQRVHKQISSVVSKCLSTVFDDPYNFLIRFVRRRGKTEAELIFERDGLEVDPLDAAGGGVVDVAAFGLRVACVLCSQPPLRKLIVLDEPFRHLHPTLRPLAAELMMELAKELDIQFIQVTLFDELLIGKVVRIK